MRIKLLAIGVVALSFFVASVWAADISGKWIVKAGTTELTLNFKVDGTKLTGTVDSPQTDPAEMIDGKIEGDNIYFAVVRKSGSKEMNIEWKGKIIGDEIRFKRTVDGVMGVGGGGSQGQKQELIAKRTK
jgi:hypothetical protein